MITFTPEEWAIIHDFLSEMIDPVSSNVKPYNGYDCIRTRIRYWNLSDEEELAFLKKLELE